MTAFKTCFGPYRSPSANLTNYLLTPWLVWILFLGTQVGPSAKNIDLCLLARSSLPVLPKLPSEVVSTICGIQGCSPYGGLLQWADNLQLPSVCFSFTDSIKGASGDHFCRRLCAVGPAPAQHCGRMLWWVL